MFQAAAETTFRAQHMYKHLYPWKSKFELAKHLSENIIHSSGGIIAINKPYGVGVNSKKKAQPDPNTGFKPSYEIGCPYSLEDVLPQLREELRAPNLVIVKSAERFSSGVSLLAEDKKLIDRLQTNVRASKAMKHYHSTYYMITTFPPHKGICGETHEERVGVTLGKNPYHTFSQPIVMKTFSRNSMKREDVSASRLVTTMMATSPHVKTSLVELRTCETKWNLLRIYCADMLMPILGDKLYGSRVSVVQGIPMRINPLHLRPGTSLQYLSPKVLELLSLKKEDSDLIPLHVHQRTYEVPNFYGRNQHLTLTAPFSDLFRWTCGRLKLVLPED